MPLKVAIVHYHLRPGGVTRIIENTVSCLKSLGVETVVLTGEPVSEESGTFGRVAVVEGLSYRQEDLAAQNTTLAERLERAAQRALGSKPDVWHIHNHTLGKNPAICNAVVSIANSGSRMLLQVHDFPEDGRPADYTRLLKTVGNGDCRTLSQNLYPSGTHIHYATINTRDHTFLADAGAPDERLHLLFNPVSIDMPEDESPLTLGDPDKRLILYPTRAIRRKNIGELLLWAAASSGEEYFATSRAPANPLAMPVHDRWVSFAESLNLPMFFALGQKNNASLASQLLRAHAVISTSVAEGFGLAFLEPWLASRPLCGRLIPEITPEFQKTGISLEGLYERLEVPLAWVNRETLRARISEKLSESLKAYGRPHTPAQTDAAMAAACCGDRVDFGRLDEPLQEEVIRKTAASPNAQCELSPPHLLKDIANQEQVQAHAEIVRREFSLEGYSQRLKEIYDKVIDSPASGLDHLDGEKLLNRFLDPARFCLLRT